MMRHSLPGRRSTSTAAVCAASASNQMHCVRKPQPERHEEEPKYRDPTGGPGKNGHPGDDRCRGQYDANLKCGRGDLIVVIAGELGIALVLIVLGLFAQLFAAVFFLRIRLV